MTHIVNYIIMLWYWLCSFWIEQPALLFPENALELPEPYSQLLPTATERPTRVIIRMGVAGFFRNDSRAGL